jgi:hypothetical protein
MCHVVLAMRIRISVPRVEVTTLVLLALLFLFIDALFFISIPSRYSTGIVPGSSNGGGNVILANSCSQGDVQAALNQSRSGDTVLIPAGTCTWSTSVLINNKSVTLEGAGINQTTIVDGNNKTGQQWYALEVYANSPGLTRVTEMTFNGGTGNVGYSFGMVMVSGLSRTWRIDHVLFITTRAAAMDIYAPGGLIDNSTFELGTWEYGIFVFNGGLGNTSAYNYGDWSWAAPTQLGMNGSTNWSVYIENNVFTSATDSVALDGWIGSREVVRHNSFLNVEVANHGTETSQIWRGARSFEIYDNNLSINHNISGFSAAIFFRSGTGVVFNNKVTGPYPIAMQAGVYREFGYWQPFGQCDGVSPYDENANVTYLTGIFNGTSSIYIYSAMIIPGENWATNQWQGYSIIDNTTGVASVIDSNTNNEIFATYDTTHGPGLSWTVGDKFTILRALVCLDQFGRGSGTLISGDYALPAEWPNEILEPAYFWNNTLNGNITGLYSESPHLISGRDFVNNEGPLPGYVPYTYPDPLSLLGETITTTTTVSTTTSTSASTTTLPTTSLATTTANPSSSGSGGGAGGGGGSSLPTVTRISSCYMISNLTQKNTVNVAFNGTVLNLTVNFITPTSAGVSIYNISYATDVGSITEIPGKSGYNYSYELLNVSYLPIQDTIIVKICSSQRLSIQSTSTIKQVSNNSAPNTPNSTANAILINQNAPAPTTTIPQRQAAAGTALNGAKLLVTGLIVITLVALVVSLERARRIHGVHHTS